MRSFLLLLLVLSCSSAVAKSFVLTSAESEFGLDQACDYLIDTSKNFSPIQPNPNIAWQPIASATFNHGFVADPIWFRCVIENRSSVHNWLVKVNNPQMASFTAYYPTTDGQLASQSTGMFTPMEQRPVKDVYPVLELPLPFEQPVELWFRFESFTPVSIQLDFLDNQVYLAEKKSNLVIHSLFFGMLCALLLYNLFLFFSMRDYGYLLYTSYLFFMGSYILMVLGYSQSLIFSRSPQSELYFVVPATLLSCFFAQQFAFYFLRFGEAKPKLLVVKYINQYLLLFAAIVGIFISFEAYVVLASLISGFILLFMLGIGIYCYLYQDYQPARYYCAAWCALLLGVTVHSLSFNNILEENFVTRHLLLAAVCTEALLLSFALGDRYNLLRREFRIKDQVAKAKLKEANQKLSESLMLSKEMHEAKQSLVTMVSHEFRTPLNIAFGSLDQLKKNASPSDDLKLSRVHESLSRISHHLENLITVGEILNQALAPDHQSLNWKRLYEEVNSFSANHPNQHVELVKSVTTLEQHSAFIDQRLFKQIITNILEFIANYSQFGEVIIDFSIHNTSIEIAVRIDTPINDKSSLNTLSQTDLSQLDLQKLGETNTNAVLVNHIVLLLGGTITIDNQDQQFTQITVTLPNYTLQQQDTHVLKQPIRHNHILIVEDNMTNALILKQIICLLGFTVDTAANGQQALEKVDSESYDLIFMDLNMPVMDGIEASKLLKKHANSDIRNIPIIAVTANSNTYSKTLCHEVGINGYICKPINQDVIVEEINKWLVLPTP